jgi:thiol:disulfide interchange protein DsbD
MRTFFGVICLFFLISTSVSGQILTPVKWDFASRQLSDSEFEISFHAKIDDKWAIYSQFIEEGGPIPTGFVFDEGSHFETIGKVEESENAKKSYDPIFEMDMIKFYKYADFKQKIIVNDLSKPVTGYLEFMTCDDERCLPPKAIDFSFTLKAKSSDDGGNRGAEGRSGKSQASDLASEDAHQPDPVTDPGDRSDATALLSGQEIIDASEL